MREVELAQEPLVIDVETERLGGGVEIGAVNEQGDFFDSGFRGKLSFKSSKLRYQLPRRHAAARHGCRTLRYRD